jgi:aminoglycoside 2'-N-acetyltransferase I
VVVSVTLVHTADLKPAERAAVRALLDAAFDGLDDADWDHALGGMHAMIWADDELVAHASVVQRQLGYQGRPVRAGYVEGVAVHADRRRTGLGDAVMAAVERVIRDAYDLGALSSSEMALPFYAARGWQLWQGRSFAMTPTGVTRTKDDDDGIYVLPVTPLDLTADLIADWRVGDAW